MIFETVLRGGTLIDGSGAVPYIADLAIEDGKIAAIGQGLQGHEVIDVQDFCVTPGFLDIHRHADAAVFREGFGEPELAQGLTGIVNGLCGLSLAPFGEKNRDALLRYLQPVTGELRDDIPTHSMRAYLETCKKLPIHVGMTVGGGTVRTDVCGYQASAPSDMRQIHQRLEAALQEGALGVSLGLGYAPECFYTTKSLISALEPLRNAQYPICVHMREEGDKVCEALDEMLQVARTLHCPLHISHLKAMGTRNWHKRIPQALRMMEQARAEGVDVSCDVYLYEAGSTQLLHLLPPDYLEGGVDGICDRLSDPIQREHLREQIKFAHNFDNIAQMVGWDNIVLSSMQRPEHQSLIGLTVTQAAEQLNLDPVDCICELLVRERCAVTMIDRINCEDDIRQILQDPFASVISDATYPIRGLPHPRVYGTYARLFETYVCKEKILSVQEAVRRITSLPSESMRIAGKGRLLVGIDADICVFRPQELRENATFDVPRQLSSGMHYVFVSGKPAIAEGCRVEAHNGSILQSRT